MKINEISYSSFTEYLMCPAKYWYRKILEIPPSFTPIELAYGSGFHSAVERLQIGKLENAEVSLDEMMEEFTKAIDVSNVRYNGQNREELIAEAKELLTIAKGTDFGKVVGVEYPIEVKIGSDLFLNGFLDMITLDSEGNKIVTDVKTSKKRLSQSDLENHLQLTTYSLAYPESELRLAIFLKQKTPGVEIMSTKRTMKQRQRLVKQIIAVRDAMQAEIWYPRESFICGNCQYFEQCHKDF